MIRISKGNTVELTFKCRWSSVLLLLAAHTLGKTRIRHYATQRHFLEMIVHCALVPLTSDEAEMIVMVWFLL